MAAWAAWVVFLCFSNVVTTSAMSMGEATNMTAHLSTSPVSRVVKLLKYLTEEIEKEGEFEQDNYEKFMCWGKDIMKKARENIDTNVRIIKVLQTETLEMQSADVMITDEKERNMKEVARLREEIAQLVHTRDKQKAEYDAAQIQMEMAVTALGEAIAVLAPTYDKYKDGQAAFLAITTDNSVYAKESEQLQLAIKLADRFLDEGDASFVRKVFTAQVPASFRQLPIGGTFPNTAAVPEHNWNKLNNPAHFKQSYKSRSGRILETFNKIKAKIIENKAAAVTTEEERVGVFTELNAAKMEELTMAQQALVDAKVEATAKLKRIQKMTIQITVFNDEMKIDEATIYAADEDMKKVTRERKQRKALREQELKAIAKTIEILHNDDSRDELTESYKSQGYESEKDLSFLQQRTVSLHSNISSMARAANELVQVAKKTGNKKLSELAVSMKSVADTSRGQVHARGQFDTVIDSIDKILEDLKREAADDLVKKEKCEAEREANTGKVIQYARNIDDFSDEMTQIMARIEKYKAEIKVIKTEIDDHAREATKRWEIRQAEQKAYAKGQADDQEAVDIINRAKENLDKFYIDNHLKGEEVTTTAAASALIQIHAKENREETKRVQRGKYNPPQVWANNAPGYMGRLEESENIMYMMDQLVKDVQDDMALHTKFENEALDDYNKFVDANRIAVEDLQRVQGVKEQGQAEEEADLVAKNNLRQDELGLMNAEKTTIDELFPACAYYTINFKMRVQNRYIEEDGLKKAKTFLMGGIFEDKSRALVVGDN